MVIKSSPHLWLRRGPGCGLAGSSPPGAHAGGYFDASGPLPDRPRRLPGQGSRGLVDGAGAGYAAEQSCLHLGHSCCTGGFVGGLCEEGGSGGAPQIAQGQRLIEQLGSGDAEEG